MSAETHPTEQLAELLDGRLSGVERRAVDAHLRDCPTCQQTLATLTAAKRAVSQLPRPLVPADLEARVLREIDRVDVEARRVSDATPAWVPKPGQLFPELQLEWRSVVVGVVAFVLMAAVYFFSRTSTDLPAAAATHVAAIQTQRLTLENPATDAAALQDYLTERMSFPVRVFDLAMMGYTISGGGVLDVDGRPAAAWVYRGANGFLLCEMFVASLDDLPPPEETRVVNDITFHIYHRGGNTQVFWEEGDVLCVLASTLPARDIIDLAIAKAMKPA